MAYISKFKLPNGEIYDIKANDATVVWIDSYSSLPSASEDVAGKIYIVKDTEEYPLSTPVQDYAPSSAYIARESSGDYIWVRLTADYETLDTRYMLNFSVSDGLLKITRYNSSPSTGGSN